MVEEKKEIVNLSDFNTFLSLYKESKLKISQEIMNEEMLNDFRSLAKVLNEFFPDNWDCNYEYIIDDDSYNITGFIIYFDTIEIKNRDGDKHTIRDLYVKIPITIYSANMPKIILLNIQGMRTTFTKEEADSSYVHSHLRRKNILTTPNFYFSPFCMGEEGLSQNISSFNSESSLSLTNQERENAFAGILMDILGLLRYESLEGVPYHYINSIGNNNRIFIIHNDSESMNQYLSMSDIFEKDSKEILKCIFNDKENYELTLVSDKVKIKITEEGEKALYESCQEGLFHSLNVKNFFCLKDNDEVLYEIPDYQIDVSPMNYNEDGEYLIPFGCDPFVFRGEEKVLKIVNSDKDDTLSSLQIVIKPNIKKRLELIIEKYIYGSKIRKSTVEKYYKS